MYKNCNTRDRRFLITNLLEFGNKSIKIHKTWVRNRKHDILYCKRDYTCSPNIAYREKHFHLVNSAVQHKNSRKMTTNTYNGVARFTHRHTPRHWEKRDYTNYTNTKHQIPRVRRIFSQPNRKIHFLSKFKEWRNIFSEWKNHKYHNHKIYYAFLDDKLETTI